MIAAAVEQWLDNIVFREVFLQICCISVDTVSFEMPIIYQFSMKLPTDLLSVIIPAKYRYEISNQSLYI